MKTRLSQVTTLYVLYSKLFMDKNVWYCYLLTTQCPAMLKLCKLRSRDWARDPPEAKNYILVLELAFYIALSVVKAREHESEFKLYVMPSNLDCCSTKMILLKNLPRSIKLLALQSSSQSLMKVKTCGFLHASSSAMQWHPSVQPKSSAGPASIFQAGRSFALARRQLRKAFRCWCF